MSACCRPVGTFYMCGPLDGIAGTSCGGKKCGPNSSADYIHTGWDQGHMISSHAGGLFAGGERQTFSMCNIWPQGKQFNETWWQTLEYTCQTYALNRKCIIMNGPVFEDGINKCMGYCTGKCAGQGPQTVSPIVTMNLKHPSHSFQYPLTFSRY